MIRATIAGASGYVGGELLRWLADHPEVEVTGATSERLAGQPVGRTHPHMRGRTALTFSKLDDIAPCDVLFLALPHGEAAARIDHFAGLAERIVDCSADFRLSDPEHYRRWYGEDHPAPAWLERFVYGLPELNRSRLVETAHASGVGCNATAVQLALMPLERGGLLNRDHPVIAEVKVGSSESGAASNAGSHHPVRSGCVRSYSPVGHRHTAEVEQTYPGLDARLSITAVEMVRGALATCHVQLDEDVAERDLLRMYRGFASDQPFVDVIHERAGLYRHPEPKLVMGTNRAQLGFAFDPERRRLVSICAIDNLGKGAAGTAVQAMNLMFGWDEATGLGFHGLHPV